VAGWLRERLANGRRLSRFRLAGNLVTRLCTADVLKTQYAPAAVLGLLAKNVLPLVFRYKAKPGVTGGAGVPCQYS
jgi:hypothetical protein